jgi:DNA-binding transcriptional LysR family regulator
MHISRVDLNLFIVFEAIYTEGSVTRASQKLNLTQPAISHALARLRQLFNDPLFERRGHAMVATPLARSSIEPVRRALRGFEVTLNGLAQFDPAQSEKQFTVAVRDVLEATILPPLIEGIGETAPGVSLAAVKVERRELESELAAGTLDIAVDVLLPLSSEVRHAQLLVDKTVVVMRKDHPRIGNALDLDAYLAEDHILASSRRRGPGLEDFELSRLGVQRRIRLRCQHYYAACRVVSRTDLLLTMPERYALAANQHAANRILPFPIEMPPFDVYLYWHANVDNDPANRWLRTQVMDAIHGDASPAPA